MLTARFNRDAEHKLPRCLRNLTICTCRADAVLHPARTTRAHTLCLCNRINLRVVFFGGWYSITVGGTLPVPAINSPGLGRTYYRYRSDLILFADERLAERQSRRVQHAFRRRSQPDDAERDLGFTQQPALVARSGGTRGRAEARER